MVGVGVIVGVKVLVGVSVCVAVGTGDGVNDGDGLDVLVAVRVAEGVGVGELSKGSWPAQPDTNVSARTDCNKKTTFLGDKLNHHDEIKRSFNLHYLTLMSMDYQYPSVDRR